MFPSPQKSQRNIKHPTEYKGKFRRAQLSYPQVTNSNHRVGVRIASRPEQAADRTPTAAQHPRAEHAPRRL